MQNLEIVEDFLPIQLGSTDVILGIQWLGSLGTMQVDWQRLEMRFKVGEVAVALHGEPGLSKTEVSLKTLLKVARQEKTCLVIELGTVEAATRDGKVPAPLAALLERFAVVFQPLSGLPPPRPCDHAITLKEGTAPISVRPYRYPQAQKDELERLVSEMLQAGIIRPSVSPYSSPVLLVPKKDGGIRVEME